MNKQILKSFLQLLILAFIGLSITSCEKSELPPEEDTVNPIEVSYGITTVSGAWPNQTSYVQGVSNLSFDNIGNENALELSGSSSSVAYNDAIFVSPFGAPASLVKYTFDDQGNTVEDERIVVPGANVFSTIYFADENLAYGSVAGGISKLIVFNQSTMRITDEVSLSTITQRIPDATRTYYLDMVERDGKLFMGIHYEKNFAPVNDTAYVAVIDLSTRTVEKVLADSRTGMVFGGQAANAGMVKAENGDIYVQGLGTIMDGGSSPSGLLKIANGETDFDPDYFMDMQVATGNVCIGIYLTPSGHVFTAKVEDQADFWEFQTGQPQFTYYELDLENKASEGAVPGIPTTYGSRRMIILQDHDGEILFTTATNDENVVYSYDTGTNMSTKLFASTGGFITGLEKLK